MWVFRVHVFHSRVAGHLGPCAPTWLNTNQVYNRADGGVTGFFKPVKRGRFCVRRYGEEFHGIIRGRTIESTDVHSH